MFVYTHICNKKLQFVGMINSKWRVISPYLWNVKKGWRQGRRDAAGAPVISVIIYMELGIGVQMFII